MNFLWGEEKNNDILTLIKTANYIGNIPDKTQWINIRSFGAKGDGISDDQLAISKAVNKIATNGGGVLYLPAGVYRCARHPHDGIFFDGISNVSIFFEAGAMLLLDNLNAENIGDLGHGIHFKGPCSNILIVNAHIKWKIHPAKRSNGDGFRFDGYPSDARTISNIYLLNCKTEQSPQTGAVFMGCSDIHVKNFQPENTLADGIHFNACRRINIDGVRGINNGDDTLAFVTYYKVAKPNRVPQKRGPYSQSTLGEWNNTDSTAINIFSKGGIANGIRLAGAKNISLSNITVIKKSCGIVIDAGNVEPPDFNFGYLASRGIVISKAKFKDCSTGFYVWNFNMKMTEKNKAWWRFDVKVQNMSAENCTNDSLHIRNCAGVEAAKVNALNRRVRLQNVKDCTVKQLKLTGGYLLLLGQNKVSNDHHDTTISNIILGEIIIRNGYLEVQKCNGITVKDLSVINAPVNGVYLSHVLNAHFKSIKVIRPNREKNQLARGLFFAACSKCRIDNYVLENDYEHNVHSIEIGGGTSSVKSKNIWIMNAIYEKKGGLNQSDVLIQEGTYRPIECYLKMLYRNAPTVDWKTYEYGNTPNDK